MGLCTLGCDTCSVNRPSGPGARETPWSTPWCTRGAPGVESSTNHEQLGVVERVRGPTRASNPVDRRDSSDVAVSAKGSTGCCLTRARAQSGVIVLRGEAGVGKSALLDHVSERVSGWHVAGAVGVESEMELAYSGLHQLCAPMMDRVDRLPDPQRDALATVFGLSARAAPDRFLVGLATLTLFAEVAEQQAARLCRRRCAVARSRVRSGSRFRCPPAPCGADRGRVRGPHGRRRRRARRASGDVHSRTRRRRLASAAAGACDRPAGPCDLRADRHGVPRQSARAPGAAAHVEARRAGRRIWVPGQPAGGRQDRTELRAAPPRTSV